MMPTIIEDADLRVNTPSKSIVKPDQTLEKLRARFLPSSSGPSHQAKVDTLLSDADPAAKLISLASIIMSDAGGQPLFSRSDLEVILSTKSRRGITEAAENFVSSGLGEVVRGVGRRPNEYRSRLLLPALQKPVADPPCVNLQTLKPGSANSGPTVGPLEDRSGVPVGSATIDSGGTLNPATKGGVVVVAETATPNEGNGSGRALTPTSTLPSPDPDISNPDITAREYIGAGASSSVVVNCATIKGPGFVIDLGAAELEAVLMGMPAERGRIIAEREARSWATQGFVPGQPDKVVASAIRKHVPQMAETKFQVAAVSEPTQAVKKWSGLLKAADKNVDKDDLETYRHPVTGEIIPMLEYVRIKSEERRNGRRKQQVPEGS